MSPCCYKFSHPQFIDTGIYYSITISTTLIYSTIIFTRGLLPLTTIAPLYDLTSCFEKIWDQVECWMVLIFIVCPVSSKQGDLFFINPLLEKITSKHFQHNNIKTHLCFILMIFVLVLWFHDSELSRYLLVWCCESVREDKKSQFLRGFD